MKSLCIKTNNNKAINYLLDNLNKIDLKDVYFSCHKFNIYNNIFIHYKGTEENLFFSTIANILSFLVLDIYEDSITRNILQKEYFYFDKFEQSIVLDKFYENRLESTEDFEIKENILFEAFASELDDNLITSKFITYTPKQFLKILSPMFCYEEEQANEHDLSYNE